MISDARIDALTREVFNYAEGREPTQEIIYFMLRVRRVIRKALEESAVPEEQAHWLIWSNEHRAWWGPGHCGYPRDVRLAGRYTLTEAKAICTQRSWEDLNVPPETMIHLQAVIGDALYMNNGGKS